MLIPRIVNTCIALSMNDFFLTAQYIPSGIVIPSARIDEKALRNNVFNKGSPIILLTSFRYVVEYPRFPFKRFVNQL